MTSDDAPSVRWEVERDRFGVMFSGPLEVGECIEVAPVAEIERLREALLSLRIYLAPGQSGTHAALGEACGVDACILCLAEHVVAEALRESGSQPVTNPPEPSA